jgi:hypothetical protein
MRNDWLIEKNGIVRGLAFFSCGCNQLKSFHLFNKVQRNKKKRGYENFRIKKSVNSLDPLALRALPLFRGRKFWI